MNVVVLDVVLVDVVIFVVEKTKKTKITNPIQSLFDPQTP